MSENNNTMHGKLINAILDICRNRTRYVDEASIKAGVVSKLLSCLGWDTFDIDELKPEYSIGSKRVDFALRVGGISKIFIEVKRLSEELEKHQEQLLGYAFQEGVKLAILTNGNTWWFYLPLTEGSWEQRRFYSVDLCEQPAEDVAKKIEGLLSKDNIKSGDAIKNAENMYHGQQKRKILREAIPRAWNKILVDPDDLFVDLLIETTEKLSGFRPEIDDIEKFLNENIKKYQVSNPSIVNTSEPTSKVIRTSLQISDDYISKKPQQFKFLGEEYHPKTWQEILTTIANKLYSRHGNEFDKCLILKGRKMIYFSTDPNELSNPKQISNSKYYVEVKLNANSIVKRCYELMTLFGYNKNDLEIFAK